MKKATLDQGMKFLEIFKEAPREHVQDLLSSGFLADLRDGNTADADRDEFRKVLGLKPISSSVLTLCDPVLVGPVRPFNPHELFTIRNRLWISNGAKYLFFSVVGYPVSLDEEITLQPFTLTGSADDMILRENLPKNHVFEADELCAVLKYMINIQRCCHLDDKYTNCFYVYGKDGEVCVVGVFLDVELMDWGIYAWRCGDIIRGYRNRIFSRSEAGNSR